MNDRSPSQPPADRLPDAAAARLLERASQLDAARGSEVADLRRAAAEAGISGAAFDAALAEMQSAELSKEPAGRVPPGGRPRLRTIGLVGAALILLSAVWTFNRLVSPAVVAAPGPPMIEEAILLRCLAPGEAAALVRPLLTLRGNTIVAAPATAPRVLTIRATSEQLRRVRVELDKLEADGAIACATRPVVVPTP